MKSLIRLSLCVASLLSMFSPRADAGVGTSGGGHVVVCQGRSADIYGFATVLDIFEAEELYKLTLRQARQSLAEELDLLATQLATVMQDSPHLPSPLTGAALIEWWDNRVQYIPDLRAETSDLGSVPPLPRGCVVKQIAVFDDSHDLVHVDLDLWNSLDDFNKAALIAHELVYRERRLDERESSSEASRFLVGRMFSTEKLLDSKTMLHCFRPNH